MVENTIDASYSVRTEGNNRITIDKLDRASWEEVFKMISQNLKEHPNLLVKIS